MNSLDNKDAISGLIDTTKLNIIRNILNSLPNKCTDYRIFDRNYIPKGYFELSIGCIFSLKDNPSQLCELLRYSKSKQYVIFKYYYEVDNTYFIKDESIKIASIKLIM